MINKDEQFLKSLICTEISNMNFKHHIRNKNPLNTFIIYTQLFIIIVGITVTDFTNTNIINYAAILNVMLLIILLVNNLISDLVWEKVKKQQDLIFSMLDIVSDNDLGIEDKYQHIGLIRGVKIANIDERYTELLIRWYSIFNLDSRKRIKYKDVKGKNYHIGDIIYNYTTDDFWLIESLSKDEMREYGYKTPYVMTLYGNKEEDIKPIDALRDVEIYCTPEDVYEYINQIVRFSKNYKLFRGEYDNQGGDIEYEVKVEENG